MFFKEGYTFLYDVSSIQNMNIDVLYFVAKASFEGTLEEERDLIPEKMIEGPEPTFRCCIYKEREIVRQRIRLAEGKAPGAEDDGNIVGVEYGNQIGVAFHPELDENLRVHEKFISRL